MGGAPRCDRASNGVEGGEEPMTVAVVANPMSGRGKGGRLIPKVEALLRSLGIRHTMHISGSPTDPERMAREGAERGAEVVVALGGDGHVGTCANGVAGTESALAVIPAGTGNDFARLLGLPLKDPLAAARLLERPVTRRLDMVRVTTPQRERYYVNVAGAGFDSEVNAYANRMRLMKGRAKYVVATFALLPGFKACQFVVVVDGQEHELPGMLIAVGNGVSYGGGMMVCPTAVPDDGLIDLCVIGDISKPEFIKTFPKVFKGTHIEHPKVTVLRGKEVTISAERTLQVFADGEHVGTLPATFTVVPSSLSVVAPTRQG
jgi:diacylglycerol kinase (ATP)